MDFDILPNPFQVVIVGPYTTEQYTSPPIPCSNLSRAPTLRRRPKSADRWQLLLPGCHRKSSPDAPLGHQVPREPDTPQLRNVPEIKGALILWYIPKLRGIGFSG